MSATRHTVTVWEDSGFHLMARIVGDDAAVITQSDISSIAYSVHDKSDGSETATGSLTVANVVYDTLQTDSRWTVDATGYNFRWAVPASIPATGGKTYQLEIAFTPASGEVFHVVADIVTKALYRS